VLAIKRCDVPIWVLPGGGIDDGETPEAAVVREIQEETGLSVSILRKVGEYTPLNRLTHFTHLFECQTENESRSLTKGAETRNAGFFPINDLPYPFLPVHESWIDDALICSEEIITKPIHGATWFLFVKYIFTHPTLMFRYILTLLGLTINSKPDQS